MRKSANNRPLVTAKPQAKPVVKANGPLKQPPSVPVKTQLVYSMGFRLQ